MNTEENARELGQKLLSFMKGNGWTLQVWENLGWHYAVNNNLISVYPSFDDKKYHCLFGYKSGGRPEWTIQESFDDPNQAVEQTLKLARIEVDERLSIVKNAEKAIIS
jgi:hypothetical protein